MHNKDKTTSKFLSLVLRHKPQTIGLVLDAQGWARVDELILKAVHHGVPLTPESLKRIVATNDKQRFVFSLDGKKIRANQGHSIFVDLQLEPKEPPEQLFHGTASKNITTIQATGLQKMKRQQVHLSADAETAKKVGSRHGLPVVITVAAGEMYRNGFLFSQAQNGVWLTDGVPPDYLQFPPIQTEWKAQTQGVHGAA